MSVDDNNDNVWLECGKGQDILFHKLCDQVNNLPPPLAENDDGDDSKKKIVLKGDAVLIDYVERQVLLNDIDSSNKEEAIRNIIQPDELKNFEFGSSSSSTESTAKSIGLGPICNSIKDWLIIVDEPNNIALPCIDIVLSNKVHKVQSQCMYYIWSIGKYGHGINTTRKYKANNSTNEVVEVPPNACILIQLHIKQIVQDTSQLNPYFTIQKALTKKNIANDIYKYELTTSERRELALKLYTKVSKDMETLYNGVYMNSVQPSHPQRKQVFQLLIDVLNNIVVIYMTSKAWTKAKIATKDVLKKDKNNLKALLRQVKIYLSDNKSTNDEIQNVINECENAISYKNIEEEQQLRKYKQQFKKLKK